VSLRETLPAATLGAIAIAAMLGLITLRPLKRYYHVNRADSASGAVAATGQSPRPPGPLP
jgi:hypothetical protein